MKRPLLVAISVVVVGLLIVMGMSTVMASDGLLHEATLKSGDYGSGTAIPTMDPHHGGSPSNLGIVDSPEGVTFTSTEDNDPSNALINWYIDDPDDRLSFRSHGTFSFMFKADRESFVPGVIFGDNYGYGEWNNGQYAISGHAGRVENEPPDDDQVRITWKTGDGDTWWWHGEVTLEYDRWYHLGFAWHESNTHELWVCGELHAQNVEGILPWGVTWGTGSATNFGLGDNHQRGFWEHYTYRSAAGVMFSDIKIWAAYQANGGTLPCEEDGPVVGGEAFPINRLVILAPWFLIGTTIILGARLLVLRRR